MPLAKDRSARSGVTQGTAIPLRQCDKSVCGGGMSSGPRRFRDPPGNRAASPSKPGRSKEDICGAEGQADRPNLANNLPVILREGNSAFAQEAKGIPR